MYGYPSCRRPFIGNISTENDNNRRDSILHTTLLAFLIWHLAFQSATSEFVKVKIRMAPFSLNSIIQSKQFSGCVKIVHAAVMTAAAF